jgi:hypothetical protein
MSVRYAFDFSCQTINTEGREWYQIGKNDVDVPIVVDWESGQISLLDEKRACFVNSSFGQMQRAFSLYNSFEFIGDNAQDIEVFRGAMLEVDSESFSDPGSFWSLVLEEMGAGVV